MTALDEISGAQAAPKQSGNYHFIWRWHFYAGLFVAPFLVILAVTGALILFKDEIESAVYRDLVQVSPPARIVPAVEQEARVLQANPGAEVLRYVVPPYADRAAEWEIKTPDSRNLTVFVDPGSGALKGALDSDMRLMNVITSIHGELLAGRFGDLVVEFAGCWAFVLLLSGLFLWWPRKNRKVGVMTPRLAAKGRGFWRELHAVPSMWNAPVIAFLILSGLPWSGFWGGQLAKFGALTEIAAPTPNFAAAPVSSAASNPARPRAHVHDGGAAHGDLPWAVKAAGLPQGNGGERQVGIGFMMDQAAARGIAAPGLRVLYPQGDAGVFTLSHVPATAQGQRTVHFDPSTGAVIQDIGWKQYSPLGKAVEFGVETHVGKQFGLANQLVLLASCLLLTMTIMFGIVMWWRRRPAGKFGAPPIPADFKPQAALVIVIIACALIFPLVGASMILVWLLDSVFRLPA